MDIQMVARFGPVDVSIIKLAERHRQERPVVLTIDQALCGICKDAGLGVRHLHEIE
jgi:hypothetical protein